MRALSIFKDTKAGIAELEEEIKKCDFEVQKLQDGPQFIVGGGPEPLEVLKKERAVLDVKIRCESARQALKALQDMDRSGNKLESASRNQFVLEAVINWRYRPALVFNKDHKFRSNDLANVGSIASGARNWRDVIEKAFQATLSDGTNLTEKAKSVARVQHSSGAVVGTAWVFGNGELLTNRHVVRDQGWFYQTSKGDWEPIDGNPGDLNFEAVFGGTDIPQDQFGVIKVNPEPGSDASVLRSDAGGKGALPVVRDPDMIAPPDKLKEELSGRLVAVIGHPSVQGENPSDEVQSVFGRAPLRLKRLMPGSLQDKPLSDDGSVLMHDCSTLRGASGSCVIDLGPPDIDFSKPLPPTFGHVIGLHFGGVWEQSNYAVPTWELAKLGLI